ncbi:MAG TPA: S9 family peptidase, partial [Cyclobacteriaceae bacterium]|nr:S9 family peptidase [Cyclobacteriaceae bacterium]
MKKFPLFLAILFTQIGFTQRLPSIEEVISLRSVGGVALSPDGKNVSFTVQSTDWNENRFDSEVWLSKNGSSPFQLTNTSKGSSTSPLFSPDGKWIAFLTDRGSKNQIYVVRTEGGEARAMTKEEEGVSFFEWHPDGRRFIFVKPEKEDKNKKEREKRYGLYEVDDKEFGLSHLWQVDFNPDQRDPSELPCYESVDSLKVKAGCIEWPKSKRLTEGKFTVTSFLISPDGNHIAFGHQPDPLINSSIKSDISLFDFATRKVTPLVTNLSSDGLEDWSPDSKEILFTSNLNDSTSNFYQNRKLFVITLSDRNQRQLAKNLDENLGGFQWRASGIYGSLPNKTLRPLYKIDPKTGNHSIFMNSPDQIFGLTFTKAGDRFAFTGRDFDQLTEVFVSPVNSPKPEKITNLS